MCSETSEAVGTTWEHAQLEFQNFLKIRITLVGNAGISDLQCVATNTLSGQLSDRVGRENWICINQRELTQYVHKYKHGQTNIIQI